MFTILPNNIAPRPSGQQRETINEGLLGRLRAASCLLEGIVH